ncbi:hypothetical protein DFH27DRAFT_616282 [Peziza echinospora]|nr:hypothetical protein DFH27DRAFT_616282 [Peziza echinospora]
MFLYGNEWRVPNFHLTPEPSYNSGACNLFSAQGLFMQNIRYSDILDWRNASLWEDADPACRHVSAEYHSIPSMGKGVFIHCAPLPYHEVMKPLTTKGLEGEVAWAYAGSGAPCGGWRAKDAAEWALNAGCDNLSSPICSKLGHTSGKQPDVAFLPQGGHCPKLHLLLTVIIEVGFTYAWQSPKEYAPLFSFGIGGVTALAILVNLA